MSKIHSRNTILTVGQAHLLIGVAALLLGGANAKAGNELFVAFRYEVNSTVRACPSETDVRRKIGQQLGYDPFLADAQDQLTFQIESQDEKDARKGSDLRGRIVWTDRAGNGRGERRFSARNGDCAQLSRDMAFAAAVQIQLLATGQSTTAPVPNTPDSAVSVAHAPRQPGDSGEDGQTADPTPVLPAKPVAVTALPVPNETTPTARPSLLIGLGPFVAWGLTPDRSFAGHVFAAALSDQWAVTLGGEVTSSSTTQDSDGAGFSSRALLVTAAGCYRASYLLACGVGKLGQMRVRGIGVDAPREPSSLLAQVGPRLALLGRLGDHFFVLGQADVVIAIDRPTVRVNHVQVWTAPRFAAAAGVDVGLRFP